MHGTNSDLHSNDLAYGYLIIVYKKIAQTHGVTVTPSMTTDSTCLADVRSQRTQEVDFEGLSKSLFRIAINKNVHFEL